MNTHRLSARIVVLEAGLVCAGLSLGACTSSGQPQSAADVEKSQSEEVTRLEHATQLVEQFRPRIPDAVASRARCLVIVPEMKKGGLLLGGQAGKGFATCATAGAWSLPAPITMSGGTLGAQVGYETADVLAIVESDSAARALEAGNFKIGGSVSATAGPVGKGASRAGDTGVKSDILSYSTSSGLFAGATLDGMTVSSDDEATRALYGTTADLASILERRATLAQPLSVQRFLRTVTSVFAPPAVSLREQRGARGSGAVTEP